MSLEVELEAGLLPALVGVEGSLGGCLPAAGDGAMLLELLEVLAVCGVAVDFSLAVGEVRLGVGGNE